GRGRWGRGGCWVLKKCIPSAVNELQLLHDKLALANPAATELQVAFHRIHPDYIAFNPSFDRGDLIEQIRRWTAWINERLMWAKKFIGELATASYAARFDQRDPLPGFAKTGVIVLHAFERTREWPCAAFRPQAEIHPEKRALGIRGGKRFQNFFGKPVKPLMIGKSRGKLPLLAVEKDKIDIRAVVELAPAEFSESEDSELSRRRARRFPQFRVPVCEDFANADLRHEREFRSCFFQLGGIGQLA